MRYKLPGFSLIELLITLCIAAILLAFFIPSFEIFLKKSREQTLQTKLLRAIHFARHEAITRGNKIILCKSADQQTCSGEWKNGLIILDGEEILQHFQIFSLKGKLFWRASLQRDELEFLPSGFTHDENGTFWYCRENQENPVWAIIISKSARARVVYPDEAQEMVDDKGEMLGCS